MSLPENVQRVLVLVLDHLELDHIFVSLSFHLRQLLPQLTLDQLSLSAGINFRLDAPPGNFVACKFALDLVVSGKSLKLEPLQIFLILQLLSDLGLGGQGRRKLLVEGWHLPREARRQEGRRSCLVAHQIGRGGRQS